MTLRKNIVAFFVIGILGTLWHFLYEWTNDNFVVGLFFPVNESIWEHLKLLFYPTLIYSAFEYFFSKERPTNYIPAVIISLIYGMFSIVAMYYIYTGVSGRNIDFINIAIFFLGIVFTLVKKNKLLKNGNFSMDLFNIFFLFLTVLLGVLFAIWSYNPPSLGIFLPPLPV